MFEVTESHQVRDLDHLEQVFAYYRSHNCKVALDDLGAGYSSLNMLVRLRPDIVKLDKELVQALPDPVSTAVISAIVSLCAKGSPPVRMTIGQSRPIRRTSSAR